MAALVKLWEIAVDKIFFTKINSAINLSRMNKSCSLNFGFRFYACFFKQGVE